MLKSKIQISNRPTRCGKLEGIITLHAAFGLLEEAVPREGSGTHVMHSGTDTIYIQALWSHKNLNTTAIYAHVSTRDLQKITSPLDRIFDDRQLKNNTLASPTAKAANDSTNYSK